MSAGIFCIARMPPIVRLRRDKTSEDIDTLATARRLHATDRIPTGKRRGPSAAFQGGR